MTVSGNVYDTVKDDSLIFSLAAYLSISQVLSADLCAGSKVSITPINDKKSAPGLPSLKNLKNAAHVRLASTDTQEDSNTRSGEKPDWVSLLAREVLSEFLSSLAWWMRQKG